MCSFRFFFHDLWKNAYLLAHLLTRRDSPPAISIVAVWSYARRFGGLTAINGDGSVPFFRFWCASYPSSFFFFFSLLNLFILIIFAVVFKVCLTGGPCSGKSTSMSVVTSKLTMEGVAVFSVPEAATLLINGGLAFEVCDEKITKTSLSGLLRILNIGFK